MPDKQWVAWPVRTTLTFVAASASLLTACGSTSPAAPAPSPLPTPTPAAAAPAPTPAPSPTPCAGCEEPAANTNPAARVTMSLYVIENPAGGYISNPNPAEPIPVGHIARLDVTAKDTDNRHTSGRGPVEFHFHNPALARIWGNHTHQRRVQGLYPGQLDCWAVQDGVRSNTVTLTFTN